MKKPIASIFILCAGIVFLTTRDHHATAGIEDPPVCGTFAAGMVDEIPDSVAGGPVIGTGLNYSIGFEPVEGFGLGYISNAGGAPAGCGGPAFPCWGHTTAVTASLITPSIESVNPATGIHHLRLAYDPATRTNTTGFGLGIDARYPRTADLQQQPIAPTTSSADLAISNPGGMNFRFQPQSNSQGCIQGSALFYEDGEIYILDDFCGAVPLGFQPTGFSWDTTGGYKNFTWSNNPYTNSQKYYYDGQLIFSGCIILGTNLEQLLIFGDNYPGSSMDVDNVVLQTLPPVCGDGFVAIGQGEQCEPEDVSNCPGRCIPPGAEGECTCTPICTLESPCPLQNGANGPYITSSGYYSYLPTSPFVSFDTCDSSIRTSITVLRASDQSVVTGANDCDDPSASCAPSSSRSCVCTGETSEQLLIRIRYIFTGELPAGSLVRLNVRKKSVCEGASVGACCDSNGPDQGCSDNVLAVDCIGTDRVWTDQGKCEELSCSCIPECTGRVCGDDGCGGSCGSCDDGVACTIDSCTAQRACLNAPDHGACSNNNVCDGIELCDANAGCVSGFTLFCDDGVFCNGLEYCNPATGCVPGTVPCTEDETCDEESDQCIPNSIPTVSQWGLVVLALVLLVAAKVRFARISRISR